MAGRVGLEDVCDLSSAWVEIVQMQCKEGDGKLL